MLSRILWLRKIFTGINKSIDTLDKKHSAFRVLSYT